MKIQNGVNHYYNKQNPLRSILALGFLMIFHFFAAAQKNKNETGNFFISNYSRSFLNSISGNWSILQDPDGVIYVGNSYDGVLVYDGQKVRRVNNKAGLPKIGGGRALAMDSQKTIYAIIGNEFGYI